MSSTPYNSDALLAERIERDAFLREHYASPISDEVRGAYAGADYFDPDGQFSVDGSFTPATDTVSVPSSSGSASSYRRVGVAHVEVVGRTYDLIVLDDGDGGAFVPFGDATNGHSTYGGGRYVSVGVPEDGTATVDFNRAVNPYCAYDDEYSCPLPPAGNIIAAAIEAGERNYRQPPR